MAAPAAFAHARQFQGHGGADSAERRHRMTSTEPCAAACSAVRQWRGMPFARPQRVRRSVRVKCDALNGGWG